MVNIGQTEWTYADDDPKAVAALESRIAHAGRRQELITYSDLVRGVQFRLPTINGGEPYEIDVQSWEPLDRALIGDFLGYISERSYTKAQFMASALVVSQDTQQPSPHFFLWMHEIHALSSLKEAEKLKFWSDQVNRAHAYFANL
jgi:hypothetical protein